MTPQKTQQKATRMTAPSQSLFTSFASIVSAISADMTAREVHRLRTTARRIEALTQYLPEKVRNKHEDVIDEIRKTRKRSGKVRDFDVQLELLRKVGNDGQ